MKYDGDGRTNYDEDAELFVDIALKHKHVNRVLRKYRSCIGISVVDIKARNVS